MIENSDDFNEIFGDLMSFFYKCCDGLVSGCDVLGCDALNHLGAMPIVISSL